MDVNELLKAMNALNNEALIEAENAKAQELERVKKELGQIRELRKLREVDTARTPRKKGTADADS